MPLTLPGNWSSNRTDADVSFAESLEHDLSNCQGVVQISRVPLAWREETARVFEAFSSWQPDSNTLKHFFQSPVAYKTSAGLRKFPPSLDLEKFRLATEFSLLLATRREINEKLTAMYRDEESAAHTTAARLVAGASRDLKSYDSAPQKTTTVQGGPRKRRRLYRGGRETKKTRDS